MACPSRAMACGMSRRACGSCRSPREGCRNRRAAAGSPKPRWVNTLAAGDVMCSAAQRAATSLSPGVGNSQRASRMASVLGVISAQRFVVVEILVAGHAGDDLVFGGEKLFVPVGLHFVDVETGMKIESQLQRARLSFVSTQAAEPLLVIALLVTGNVQLFDLRHQVIQVAGFEF